MPPRIGNVTGSPTVSAAEKEKPGRCACTEGERDVFLTWVGRLVHAHRRQLLAVARREGLGPDDAFDAVQEAFAKFLGLPTSQTLIDGPDDDSRKLLIALTRNLARNRRRLAALARPHDSDATVLAGLSGDTPTVDQLLATAEDEVRLRGCVQGLGEAQRTVVTLRMLDEAPGEDVARALGITPGHVAVLLHRAKANLRSCMTT